MKVTNFISVRNLIKLGTAYAVFSLLLAPNVHAQEITTTASPPRLELETLPDNTLQETLKLTNSSDTLQTYSITATDFIVNDSKGTPVPVTESVSGRWSLASWLTTTPENISVEPNQSVLVTLQVKVPEDALPGGHYAMVTYQPTTANLENQTGSAVASRVGTLVYLKVQGDITEAAYLKQLSTKNKWFEYGPIDITAEIENQGDIHLKPAGKIEITDLLNRPILIEDLDESNIFPFASRLHQFQLPNKYYLGRFKVKLEASAGTSALPINGAIYFWVIPYKEISVVLAAIILVVVLLALKRRKKQSQPLPETGQPSIEPETPETTPPATLS